MARRKHENLRERSPEFRKGEHIEVLKSFLIACEGECTEPNYINGLVKYQKQQHLIAAGNQSNHCKTSTFRSMRSYYRFNNYAKLAGL